MIMWRCKRRSAWAGARRRGRKEQPYCVIASVAKQSSVRARRLDCFATLAMTAGGFTPRLGDPLARFALDRLQFVDRLNQRGHLLAQFVDPLAATFGQHAHLFDMLRIGVVQPQELLDLAERIPVACRAGSTASGPSRAWNRRARCRRGAARSVRDPHRNAACASSRPGCSRHPGCREAPHFPHRLFPTGRTAAAAALANSSSTSSFFDNLPIRVLGRLSRISTSRGSSILLTLS